MSYKISMWYTPSSWETRPHQYLIFTYNLDKQYPPVYILYKNAGLKHSQDHYYKELYSYDSNVYKIALHGKRTKTYHETIMRQYPIFVLYVPKNSLKLYGIIEAVSPWSSVDQIYPSFNMAQHRPARHDADYKKWVEIDFEYFPNTEQLLEKYPEFLVHFLTKNDS